MKEHLLEQWHSMDDESEFDETDAGSIIFVELVHSEFKIDANLSGDSEKVEVIR